MSNAPQNLLTLQQSPIIMGVLNVGPDSFSDGGKYSSLENAVAQAELLVSQGAQVIDIGGESTAPGSSPISADEECARVLPVVRELAGKIAVSVDTYKASVAQEALKLGATMINDISALRADPAMAKILASHYPAPLVIIMHSKENPQHPHVSSSEKHYEDVVSEVLAFLKERVAFALKTGIPQESICVDPGMGRFLSHSAEYSWELLARYQELTEALLPYPVAVATSRKGFLGGPLANRDPISQLTALEAVRKGARLVRTHNVQMMRQFLDADRNLSFARKRNQESA